ncbi:hypothetical protein CWI38_0427p0010 [Hamiltosporidium tvaerminnensis]|uniref:Uncharacterized protein n=1 Tax=Hamiltosporidium tvaerminnensis TaxID=1176355 RepID=A0A4Q9LXD7_9MICR|nr:hypothetical protein CWI38_0427p0010 [Hamiltosporidium tvaerminnensis]
MNKAKIERYIVQNNQESSKETTESRFTNVYMKNFPNKYGEITFFYMSLDEYKLPKEFAFANFATNQNHFIYR